MTTKIWIEPLKHPDGRPRYNGRGRLYRTRAGGPDGPVLCERTILPATDSCRVLTELGITGRFETWREGESAALMTGDIEKAAGVTVTEGSTKSPRFVRWQAHPGLQNAISRAGGSPPERDNDTASGVVAENSETHSTLDGEFGSGHLHLCESREQINKAGLNELR